MPFDMNALNNSIKIWQKAGSGIGFRSQLLAFLCARFGTLAERRQKLRAGILKLIGCFARDGQVVIRFRVSNQPLTCSLREGNKADYLVFGEMVMGGYKLPVFLSQPPSHVVDGGANIGMFSLFAHAFFPTANIICYEPESHNFAQLRKNLDANEIVAEIVPKALWSKSAELFFHPGESYSGHVNAETSPYPISCIQPSVPDQCWLKLDIEGAEYEVLPALLKAGCRPGTISMEIHDFNHRGNFLLSLLKAYGYSWNELFQPTEPCITINAFKERI
jgi:FkbM family methyltransferase